MALNLFGVTARTLALPEGAVRAVVELLEGGSTVPFVARYRKEATGGLDEVQIRAIDSGYRYVRELEERRAVVLAEIEQQGKLTDALRGRLLAAATKAELEDLYLPYKPKRRTRAQIARERGLEPLAARIWAQPERGSPQEDAAAFVNTEKGVPDAAAALSGARDIVAERIAEDAIVRKTLRERFAKEGLLTVRRADDVSGPTKFEAYYAFQEPLRGVPSHRFLAVRRGEAEGVLVSTLEVDVDGIKAGLERHVGVNGRSAYAGELRAAVSDAGKRLLAPSIETDVRNEAKTRADEEAVKVFGQNLRALLLAAPFGARPVIAIDPGQRTGCKVAVLDATGKLLEHTVLFLVQGESAMERSRGVLNALIARHQPAAIAVGNGTHGRETEAFVRDALRAPEGGQGHIRISNSNSDSPHGQLAVGKMDRPRMDGPIVVSVNESGASVYSASDVAREELPDVDLTVRGAVSIGRRLQDPLAELVKIEPQSIGVGQYQHDVHQPFLVARLDAVVESCVNQVGVELNTASAPLLAYVAGIGKTVAQKIVAHREAKGPFASRAGLKKVSGVGPKTFEQAAGFLRVQGGRDPLDASAVHPERYDVVAAMARDLGTPVKALVGNAALAARIEWQRYVAADLGEPTLRDIIAELARPGRDPRETFEATKFRADVTTMGDLKPGMSLEGVVTNVTAFGAFVDVGVHQDGLVHVSQLAERFVRDPAEVVKPGDRLSVRVLAVDMERKRISLTARKDGMATVVQTQPAHVAAPSEKRPEGRPPMKATPPVAPSKPMTGPGFHHNPFEKLLKK